VTEPSIIAPAGDLDLGSVDEFRESLRTATGSVIVDLSDVDFIDSSGLGAILEVNEQLRRERRRLSVVAPRGTQAAVLLTLTGLRRSLPVFESRSAAERS
jgi:anti-anti-sigma factor